MRGGDVPQPVPARDTNTTPRKPGADAREFTRRARDRGRLQARRGGDDAPGSPTAPYRRCRDRRASRRESTTSRGGSPSMTIASRGSGARDRHLEIEPDNLAAAAHADRRLARPGDPAGGDAGPIGDHRFDRRTDVFERQPSPRPTSAHDSAKPRCPSRRAATPACEFLDGQSGADLRAQRAAALGRVDDAGDCTCRRARRRPPASAAGDPSRSRGSRPCR